MMLEITLAWVEVQVVNVERQESTQEDPQDIVDPTPTRLSLLRIREVKERDVFPLLSWTRFRSRLVQLVPLGRSFASTAVAIGAIVAVGVTIIWLIQNSVPIFDAVKAAARNARSRPPVAIQPVVSDQTISEPSTPPAQRPKVVVPKKAVRQAHPDFLLKPQVARRLSLRQDQREALRKLSEEHRTAAGNSPTRLRQKTLQILTNEQRQLLRKLQAET